MATRDNYQVSGATLEDLTRNLNFLLQRLADRMDKIEGIRGTSSIESNLEMNSNRIIEVAAAVESDDALIKSQADLTGEGPTFANATITNTLTVGGETTLNDDLTINANVSIYDDSGALIHSME